MGTVSIASADTPSLASPSSASEGLRVGYFSSYWLMQEPIKLGASDYWRMAVPAEALSRRGFDVKLSTCLASRKDGTLQIRDPGGNWHDDREVVVMQRWMGEGMDGVIKRARATGQVIVNDVDDYYWALPRGHDAYAGTDPTLHKRFNRDHYRKVLRASSLITTSTNFLSNALKRWGPPVEIIPNYINLFGWRSKPPGKYIGWVGAIPWRDDDLSLLRDAVVPWLREHDETFFHGGHMNRARSVREQLGYDRVSVAPARPLDTYPLLWDSLRLALIPLLNSTFNNSKSWVKGLEACARGIPFIASDHPEYRKLGVGRLVTRPHEWREHLDALQDPDAAEADGMANRARAHELSIENHWQEWAAVLREAVRSS